MKRPDNEEQIAQTHASLIHSVVQAIQNTEPQPQLEQGLVDAEKNGWQALVQAIRQVMAGQRDMQVLLGLDEEDTVIVRTILEGLQDPSSLPDPAQQGDATQAAPMLAHLIHEASTGNVGALTSVSQMAEQMSKTDGDMAQLSVIIKPLIDGERDVDKLCERMGAQGESLVVSIINELNKYTLQ